MSMTITVDASAAAFANGVNLRVEVLTNAAATQNGAATTSVEPTGQKAITTTATGSRVYGSALNNNSSTLTINTLSTAIDSISDATNGIKYGSFKQKTDTVTPGSETLGYTNSFVDGGIAMYEVLPITGRVLTEDGSAPPVKTVTNAKVATCAGFTPPQGSLLVVLASAATDGAFTISDSLGLTWTQKAFVNTDGACAVWIAQVPGPNTGDPYLVAIGGWASGTSVTLPVLHDVGVGDVVIVETSTTGGIETAVPTDTQSNIYSSNQTNTASQNSANFKSQITTGLVAGTDTITCVRSNSTNNGNIIIIGVPNAAASTPVEGSSVSKTGSGTSTAPTVTSGTLSQASEVIVAAISDANVASSPVWASPFDQGVLGNEVIASGATRLSAAWARVNTTTAVTAAGTLPSSATWEVLLTAIKITPTGGIGSVAMHKMGLAASGGEKESGAGSVARHKMGVAVVATTNSKVTATGSVKMHKMGSSVTGKETEAGTGSVAMHKMGMSDAGTEKFTATGSVKMHKMGLGASGKETEAATGSVRMHKMGLSSSGKETEAGTGSIAMHKMGVHGFNAVPISGSGSVARHKMGLGGFGDPASIRLDNNAEGGTNGTTVTTGNSGGASGTAWNSLTIASPATLTYSNAHSAHGALSYAFNCGTGFVNDYLQWNLASTPPQLWMRAYVYIAAAPANNLQLLRACVSGGSLAGGIGITSAGKIYTFNSAGTFQTTSTTTVPFNQWFRLEGYVIGSATAGQIQVKLFTSSPDAIIPDEVNTSGTAVNTNGVITQMHMGNSASVAASYVFYLDDLAVSTRGYIGPVPMATVARHKMGISASGTQTGPTWVNNFSGLTNGTTLTTGNTGGVSGYPFDVITIPAAAVLAADNTHLGLDAMALKVATTTTTGSPAASWTTSVGAARTKLYFRVDFLKTVSASPACRPIAFRTSGATHVFSILVSGNALSGSYGSGFSGLTAFTTATANGSYFRVEGWFDTVAGTAHIELYAAQKDAYPVEQHDYSGLTFGNNVQKIDIGNANNATSDGPFWIDLAAVSPDAPISPPSVKMHKMGLTAAAKEIEAATGSVHMHKMGMASTGHVAYGAVKMHKMGLSSSGKEIEAATGSVHMHKMGLSSSGKETEAGTGSVKMHKMGVAAAGTESGASGSISVHMHKMGLAVAGRETESGTGSVHMHKMGLAESGVETFFGTGDARMHKMGIAGTAELKLVFHGTVSVRMHKMHILGQNPPIEHGSLFVFTAV